MDKADLVVYWDASAVLSLLFDDIHTENALSWWKRSRTVHLLSSLAFVEAAAVIGLLGRTGSLDAPLVETAYANLAAWGWRKTSIQPDSELAGTYARRWPLRGADLWHLACACTLHRELPELRLLTYDKRLHEAAVGEEVAVMS
ncbi:MAG: type II toxin-antitoxin system VapC family toxin [Candidatus Electrothrix scaldis]|nr:MAG: type II toxin-antitoxin system VapC family toxin [Candidatus Electrothrix sp. GW3-3]